jgi:hypothetical protein
LVSASLPSNEYSLQCQHLNSCEELPFWRSGVNLELICWTYLWSSPVLRYHFLVLFGRSH